MEDPLENVFKKQNKIAKDPEKTVKVNLIDSSHKYNIPGKFFLNANDQIVNAVTILSRGYQLLKNNGTSKT